MAPAFARGTTSTSTGACGAAFDYTKELTNNQNTTYYREDVFGDIWTDLVYSTALDALSWPGTRPAMGVRAQWPTSKTSRANGLPRDPGRGRRCAATSSRSTGDERAVVLNDFHVSLSATYLHAFTNSTTPTSYGDFQYTRQDVDDHSFISDQLAGQTLVDHTFWAIHYDTGLQITPKLSFTADGVLINQWHYAPGNTQVQTGTGVANPVRVNDNQFTQSVWVIADIELRSCATRSI